MARNTALTIDSRDLEKFGERLGDLTAEELGKARVDTINEVADRTYDLARDRMISGINLTDAYLRRKMSVTHATPGKPQAVITASGARDALTVLGRYDAKPQIVPNKAPGKRKGNRALGIAPGSRQLGVTVEVKRGASKEFERGFLLPLKRGVEAGGNGFGVFARTRAGRLVHRYGPSVYQLFAHQIAKITDEVQDDMETTLFEQVDLQLKKAFDQ